MKHVSIFNSTYRDSLAQLQLNEVLERLDSVESARVVMGTPLNIDRLRELGFHLETGLVTPNDLCIALDVTDESAAARGEEVARAWLSRADAPEVAEGTALTARSLEGALELLPHANLALISVPGEYAAAEADRALDMGLHVFLFSDNVSIEDERRLKQRASEKHLLLMGPDCGSALIDGVPLGFMNAVRRGDIGIVSASGTGLQEVSCLIHAAGAGVSHAIGTGGRDLTAPVAGVTCRQALALLERDPATRVIVLVSKPPAAEVTDAVMHDVSLLDKPCVVLFLGSPEPMRLPSHVRWVRTLEDAAQTAVQLSAGGAGAQLRTQVGHLATAEARDRLSAANLSPDQRFVRGLFTGGTLAEEAAQILSAPHTVVDLGDDELTRGRLHPMMDPSARHARMLATADDPRAAVVLADVVLGYGVHHDPAGALASSFCEARARARSTGRDLLLVASVCGTDDDQPGLTAQSRTLETAGAWVLPTSTRAAGEAGKLAHLLTPRSDAC